MRLCFGGGGKLVEYRVACVFFDSVPFQDEFETNRVCFERTLGKGSRDRRQFSGGIPPHTVDERFALEWIPFLERGSYAVLPVKVAT